MRIVWDEAALNETHAAAVYYHSQQADLGQRFLDAVETAVSKISHRPLLYRKIADTDVRKCKLPRFPFGIIYRVQEETLFIIAVMHFRQAPGYWQHRINPSRVKPDAR